MKRIFLFLFPVLLLSTSIAAQATEPAPDEVGEIVTHFNSLLEQDNHGITTSIHAGTEDTQFTDLAAAAWAKDSIEFLVKRGILAGMGDGRFAPDNSVTRVQYVKMLVLSAGLYNLEAVTDLTDVDGHWGYSYIASAFNQESLGSAAFRPDESISREDMAYFTVLLMRRAGYSLPDANSSGVPFADWEDIAPYARDSVAIMVQQGLISGVGDNRFAPKNVCTRAAAAKILAGMMQLHA